MKKTKVYIVIGRGYGDEGKGLTTDYLASRGGKTLVVRHNGGAQAGHTVEWEDRRFVFHELSSGSFRGADTLWAETFLPDLYKLREEAEAFRGIAGSVPRILAGKTACVTLVDDVLLNMALETKRGAERHGSCGMGINEADLRGKAGYGVSIGEIAGWDEEMLAGRMRQIRREYLPVRMEELGLSMEDAGEYGELLRDGQVLENAAREMLRNMALVQPVEDCASLLREYETVIFESGQGLLLDAECRESMPHVTASRTGLANPVKLLAGTGLSVSEVIYAARSYLTRHGAGPLRHECMPERIGRIEPDATNTGNVWQGELRYALYDSLADFLKPVREDLRQAPGAEASLLLTHLNETDGKLRFAAGDMDVERLWEEAAFREVFSGMYLSYSGSSGDIVKQTAEKRAEEK